MKKFDERMENEEVENIIVLNDEEGNEVEFEFLDLIEYEGEEYAVLLPLEEGADEMALILRVEEGDEETDNFVGIDEDETVQAVFEIFKERFKDEFNFKD